MIIGGYVCRYGQRSLLFVQQNLEDDIMVLLVSPIKHKLDVGGHGEHQAGPPTVTFQLFKVSGLVVEAVDAQQACQRQHYRLMTEAQLYTRVRQLQTAVGVVDKLSQQVPLRVGLVSAVEQRRPVHEVPPRCR